MALKNITTKLTVEQIKRLEKLAGQTGVQRASHIRQAVNDYLKKNEGG
jgi:predicted transcriptional regulator